MTFGDREVPDVEALRTDRYLDALLAAAERRATDVPSGTELDPAIRLAATRLARDLVRVHPSFRFEDRLAARLGEAARAMRWRAAAGGSQTSAPRAFSRRPAVDPHLAKVEGDQDAHRTGRSEAMDPLDPVDPRHVRPLLVGGALTSAALAGAAWVAWRRSRPAPRSPMARAVRAARQARLVRGLS